MTSRDSVTSDDPIGVPFSVGGRLPPLARPDGVTVWRPQYTRHAVVLAVLHGEGCEPCTRYGAALAGAQAEFRAWDGRLVVAADPALSSAPDVTQVADRFGDAALITDTFGGAPRVIVADRFGHIYHVEDGGPAHALSEPRELEEWLRFIGTQCPE
jgi:hypothetical protein